MTHKPPIPEANQSPYPIQEPPHEAPEPAYDVAEAASEDEASVLDTIRDKINLDGRQLAGIVAAVGLGAVAAGSALFFTRRDRKSNSRSASRAKSKRKQDA